MKKNVMLLSCAALLALALAGCSQSTAQADYIGTDAAKAIATDTPCAAASSPMAAPTASPSSGSHP